MQFELTVTHTLAPEFLEILKFFTKSQGETVEKLTDIKETLAPKPKRRTVAVTPTGLTDVPEEATKAETPTEVAQESISSEVKEIMIPCTFEELRAVAVEKGRASQANKDTINSLLADAGAKGLTTLAKEQYPAFMEKLKAL